MENHNVSTTPMLQVASTIRPRLVSKDGECQIQALHLSHVYRNSCRNWFHLIIECTWRRIIILFAAGFLISWIVFGIIYYTIVLLSGDLKLKAENKQCIANVDGFISAFLFSLESQHTVGYGSRFMTDVCPQAFIVLCVQLIVGVFLQTLLAGIIVAKILRPKKRKQEIRFSRYAVIGPISDDDRTPTLMIRIADVQHKLYLAESHIRLYIASFSINKHGEREFHGLRDVDVGYDRGWDRVLLLWPIIVRHVINEESPLYGITKESLQNADFELIITVEGIVEATGMTFQSRSSFLSDEVLWWHQFVPIISLNEKRNNYQVDYNLFDKTERIDVDSTDGAITEVDSSFDYFNSSGFI